MRIVENTTLAAVRIGDVVRMRNGWATIESVEPMDERGMVAFKCVGKRPFTWSGDVPLERQLGEVRLDRGTGFLNAEDLYTALVGANADRLWDLLARTLNALEKAGENPSPTTAGAPRLSGASGGAKWDEDARTWRTEERF